MEKLEEEFTPRRRSGDPVEGFTVLYGDLRYLALSYLNSLKDLWEQWNCDRYGFSTSDLRRRNQALSRIDEIKAILGDAEIDDLIDMVSFRFKAAYGDAALEDFRAHYLFLPGVAGVEE